MVNKPKIRRHHQILDIIMIAKFAEPGKLLYHRKILCLLILSYNLS